MSLPVLRETRMPAVICEIGPATVVVERGCLSPGRWWTPWPSGSGRPGTEPRVPAATLRREQKALLQALHLDVIHNLMHRLWMKLYRRFRDETTPSVVILLEIWRYARTLTTHEWSDSERRSVHVRPTINL